MSTETEIPWGGSDQYDTTQMSTTSCVEWIMWQRLWRDWCDCVLAGNGSGASHLPCITTIAEQQPVLTVAATTHLTAGLLQIQIHLLLLASLCWLLDSDLHTHTHKYSVGKVDSLHELDQFIVQRTELLLHFWSCEIFFFFSICCKLSFLIVLLV